MTNKKKLSLCKESIRILDAVQLGKVVGGIGSVDTCDGTLRECVPLPP